MTVKALWPKTVNCKLCLPSLSSCKLYPTLCDEICYTTFLLSKVQVCSFALNSNEPHCVSVHAQVYLAVIAKEEVTSLLPAQGWCDCVIWKRSLVWAVLQIVLASLQSVSRCLDHLPLHLLSFCIKKFFLSEAVFAFFAMVLCTEMKYSKDNFCFSTIFISVWTKCWHKIFFFFFKSDIWKGNAPLLFAFPQFNMPAWVVVSDIFKLNATRGTLSAAVWVAGWHCSQINPTPAGPGGARAASCCSCLAWLDQRNS